MTGKICEVFESVQGEGLYLGERQVFVRFFGCNLSCKFCDTRINQFQEFDAQGLFQELKKYKARYHSVSFTGGEPLLQKEFLQEVLKLTSEQGMRNYLETNGTLPEDLEYVIEYVDIVSMDLKFPSSTGLKGYWPEHRKFLKIASRKEVFLKAVVCQDTKEEDLVEALKLIQEVNKTAVLILQPDSYDGGAGLQEKLVSFKDLSARNNITACIIPQVHKIAGIK